VLGPDREVGKRIEWAEVQRSQERGGTPVGRCTRKGFRALVDESVRIRGAEGAERWERGGGRGGSGRSYKFELASKSMGEAISTCEATHTRMTG
jgi:hypothetical protein